jgi:signal peptidase II
MVLAVSAVLLLVLDQGAKVLVLARPRKNPERKIGGGPFGRVINVQISRGLPGARSTLLTLWVLETALLLGLVQYSPTFQGFVAQASVGAALGGASGNLFDRLWRGGVVDYIDLKVWPVFNLADMAIVGGGVIGCAAFFFGLTG